MSSPKLPAFLTGALIAVATLLAASPRASAQLPSASVRSLGLSGSDTAMARGVGAISSNPAGLAMPDSRFGDSLAAWPTLHAGVGAEYRPVDVIELRAGAALISDAVRFSGGASIILGPCNLSIAMAATTTGGLGAQIGLLSFGIR